MYYSKFNSSRNSFIIEIISSRNQKPLIPFLSGIGELIARAFICLFIPNLINPTNPLSNESYIGLCFSTPLAWLVSVIIMGGSLIYYMYFSKTFKMNDINIKKDID